MDTRTFSIAGMILLTGLLAGQTVPSKRPPVIPPRNTARPPAPTKAPTSPSVPKQAATRQSGTTTPPAASNSSTAAPCGQPNTKSGGVRGMLGSFGANAAGGSRPCTTATSTNRAPLNVTHEGIGSFPGCCGFNLVAYGCFRNNGQVLCDFDVTNSGTSQANARSIYNDLHMVSASGRVFPRTDAFFVDSDGSPFMDSQVNAGNNVRFVMIFEGVPDSYSTVSLTHGNDVVANVRISAQEGGGSAYGASSGAEAKRQ